MEQSRSGIDMLSIPYVLLTLMSKVTACSCIWLRVLLLGFVHLALDNQLCVPVFGKMQV